MRLILLLVTAFALGACAEHGGKQAEHAGNTAGSSEHGGAPADAQGDEHGGTPAEEAGDEHGGQPADEGGDEHGGDAAEDAGDEHGGDPAGEDEGHDHEDASDEHAGEAAADVAAAEPKQFFAEDIKRSVRAHIAERSNADGVFEIYDSETDQTLQLRFVEVHDPVRQIDGNTYFACTDFHVVGEENKLYDLDFWMNPETGELAVYDERIHKEPRKSLLYGWYKEPRYTFVNDKVVSLY